MKLLNLGCGSERPQEEEWTNIDDLYWQIPNNGPEREALDKEPNYINFVIGSERLPFEDNEFDGILASHFFEHFDAQQGLWIMQDCYRILKPGGELLISVPNASYFRRVYLEDRNENWPRLFDVSDSANPIPTFFQAALWFDQHKAILTEDALWCYLTRAGFMVESENPTDATIIMSSRLNRIKFSLTMIGRKA